VRASLLLSNLRCWPATKSLAGGRFGRLIRYYPDSQQGAIIALFFAINEKIIAIVCNIPNVRTVFLTPAAVRCRPILDRPDD
jgi:hypothetical protein